MLASNASVNSTCDQPSPPTPSPQFTEEHLPALSILGVEHLQILHCPGDRHFPTPWPFPSFWHARCFLSECNYTEGFTGKKKNRLAHMSRTGTEIEESCKGMFSISCMHFFIAYQNYIPKLELSMWINVLWLLNQISVDIIWRTSCHIYKTIHNI